LQHYLLLAFFHLLRHLMMETKEEEKKTKKGHCDDCEEEEGGMETLTLILVQWLTFFQNRVLFAVKKRALMIAQLVS